LVENSRSYAVGLGVISKVVSILHSGTVVVQQAEWMTMASVALKAHLPIQGLKS
jgi:hypothetical protein